MEILGVDLWKRVAAKFLKIGENADVARGGFILREFIQLLHCAEERSGSFP